MNAALIHQDQPDPDLDSALAGLDLERADIDVSDAAGAGTNPLRPLKADVIAAALPRAEELLVARQPAALVLVAHGLPNPIQLGLALAAAKLGVPIALVAADVDGELPLAAHLAELIVCPDERAQVFGAAGLSSRLETGDPIPHLGAWLASGAPRAQRSYS